MVDKTLILKRLKELKKFSKDVEFAQFLGISSANISAWLKRNTFDYNIIVEKFPEVNKNWLLTGEGEMLKGNNTKPKEIEVSESSIYSALLESNERLSNTNKILAESNAKLVDTTMKLFESNQKLVDQVITLTESQKRDVEDVRGVAKKVAHG